MPGTEARRTWGCEGCAAAGQRQETGADANSSLPLMAS